MKSCRNEVEIKQKRLLEYIRENGYEAVIIGRQDNFSWLTCGGTNHVVITSENGACILVIGEKDRFVLANTMDGQRIIDEEMLNMDYELVNIYWYDGSPAKKAAEMLKGRKVLSDIPVEGFDYKPDKYYDMHYPLCDSEVERYRTLGVEVEKVLKSAVDSIRPGMTEKEAAAVLMCGFASNDFTTDVLLMAGGDRIASYRHPIPSGKLIQDVLMIAVAVSKGGLTVPVTRMIFYGSTLPEELGNKYDALCRIEAEVFSMCTPGRRFSDIFAMQKQRYADYGYPKEWQKHAQGGITGYVINNPSKCLDKAEVIKERQTFNWYITISGAKVEETFLTTSTKKEILTSCGLWPVKEYRAGSECYNLPQILIK